MPLPRTKKKQWSLFRALLRVDMDFGSSGIWEIKEPKQRTMGKGWMPDQELPSWLRDRFNYWTSWFEAHEPWKATPGLDAELWRAYGFSLAIDLKRMLGDEYYVEYGGREIHDDREYLREWHRKSRK